VDEDEGGARGTRERSAGAEPGEQVDDATLALAQVGDDLLVEQLDRVGDHLARQLGDEELQEVGEESGEQLLEEPVVVGHAKVSSRSARRERASIESESLARECQGGPLA